LPEDINDDVHFTWPIINLLGHDTPPDWQFLVKATATSPVRSFERTRA
jgi:hypothetical protein